MKTELAPIKRAVEKIVIEAIPTRKADSGVLNIVDATKFAVDKEIKVKMRPDTDRKTSAERMMLRNSSSFFAAL